MSQNQVQVVQAAPELIGITDTVEQVRTLTPQTATQARIRSSSIDFHNPTKLSVYAEEISSAMVEFNDQVISSSRNRDMDQVGKTLRDVAAMARSLDPDMIGKEKGREGGFLGFGTKPVNFTVDDFHQQFDVVGNKIAELVRGLQSSREQVLKRSSEFEEMYRINLTMMLDFSIAIEAGKIAIENANKVELPALRSEAQISGDFTKAREVADFEASVQRFDKQIMDLEELRTDCLITADQIRLFQGNALRIADNISTTLAHTVPNWKKGMAFSIGLYEQEVASKLDHDTRELNDEMRRRVAQRMKDVSIAVAEQAQRGAISVDTIEFQHTTMLETMDALEKIATDGEAARAENRKRLDAIETQMKARYTRKK